MTSFTEWSAEEWDENEKHAMALVGRFLQYWATVEWEINDAIGKCLGLNDIQTIIVTSNVQFRDKIHILRAALVFSNIAKRRLYQEADKMLLEIARRSAHRNLMAHTVFWGAENKDGVEFWVRRARGALEIPDLVWPTEKFEREADDLLHFRLQLEELNLRLRPLSRRSLQKLERGAPNEAPMQQDFLSLLSRPLREPRNLGKKNAKRKKFAQNRPKPLA